MKQPPPRALTYIFIYIYIYIYIYLYLSREGRVNGDDASEERERAARSGEDGAAGLGEGCDMIQIIVSI
jgi:hypothetical protein